MPWVAWTTPSPLLGTAHAWVACAGGFTSTCRRFVHAEEQHVASLVVALDELSAEVADLRRDIHADKEDT